jgi:hypothetical protein
MTSLNDGYSIEKLSSSMSLMHLHVFTYRLPIQSLLDSWNIMFCDADMFATISSHIHHYVTYQTAFIN